MNAKRKDVVRVAEKDPNYGKCGTCRHYQNLTVCSKCSHLNKYSFAWRDYVIQNPDKFTATSQWIKTDDLQWRKQIDSHSFELVEVRSWPDNTFVFVNGEIKLDDYTQKEILLCIQGYGYNTLEAVKELYKGDANGVIAECLFEQTSENELNCFGPYASEDDAKEEAEKHIDKNAFYMVDIDLYAEGYGVLETTESDLFRSKSLKEALKFARAYAKDRSHFDFDRLNEEACGYYDCYYEMTIRKCYPKKAGDDYVTWDDWTSIRVHRPRSKKSYTVVAVGTGGHWSKAVSSEKAAKAMAKREYDRIIEESGFRRNCFAETELPNGYECSIDEQFYQEVYYTPTPKTPEEKINLLAMQAEGALNEYKITLTEEMVGNYLEMIRELVAPDDSERR